MALSSLIAAVDGNAPCCHFVASGMASATLSEIASCNRLALSSSMAAVNGCGDCRQRCRRRCWSPPLSA